MADIAGVKDEFSAEDQVLLTVPAKIIKLFEERGIRCATLKFEELSSPGVCYYLGVPLDALKRA